MGNFYNQTDLFERVVAQHAHVVPAKPVSAPIPPRYVQ
jgi:hypothetical protein